MGLWLSQTVQDARSLRVEDFTVKTLMTNWQCARNSETGILRTLCNPVSISWFLSSKCAARTEMLSPPL
jgi:hypothetical protein